MKTIITGRNMSVTPAIEDRVEKKTRAMSRYLPHDVEMQLRMRKEKSGMRIVEITVPLGNNVILRSEAAADDLFIAIDQALVKLEKQIHRHRTKLSKRLREDAFEAIVPEYMDEEATVEEGAKQIVRRKTFPVRPMSEEDAIIQMELLGHSFFVFVNQETERTNVLYARKDGTLGLLEPEA